MDYTMLWPIVLATLMAFLAVSWVYFKILRIALDKNLVDNPGARKLQKRPIPVLGGIAVFFGELGWNPQTTSFEELVRIMVAHDMQKVAADHVAGVMRTNLAEYLEKGITK